MKNILVFAPYPTDSNTKDGMMQRVLAVDTLIRDGGDYSTLSYINVKFKRYKTEIKQINNNTFEYYCSFWSSLLLVKNLINQADTIYSHSIYGFSLASFFFMKLMKEKNAILDVHGIVPEELSLGGRGWLRVKMYSLLEKHVFKYVKKIIVVSNKMGEYIKEKYPQLNFDILTYPILPSAISSDIKIDTDKSRVVNILYSGNLQVYQNIPSMLDFITRFRDIPNIKFYLLTGEPQRLKDMLREREIDETHYTIDLRSVTSKELDFYYQKAHYGIILRDDIAVNNVASPTKLTEYLAYGMIPIVLSEKIGDFDTMGYQYLQYKEVNPKDLEGIKSKKNNEVYLELLKITSVDRFRKFIEK
jgi:hypothetical protein